MKSNYWFVYYRGKGKKKWIGKIEKEKGKGNNILYLSWEAKFYTEKEAAIAVDRELIKRGKEPRNILSKISDKA